MLNSTMAALPADAAICAAAVADYRIAAPADQKMKKEHGEGPPSLDLIENPDILATLGRLPNAQRPRFVIGFAAETEKLIEHATNKRARKGCD